MDGASGPLGDAGCLLITGYTHNALGNDVLEPGMEVITKPFTLDAPAGKIQIMITR